MTVSPGNNAKEYQHIKQLLTLVAGPTPTDLAIKMQKEEQEQC